MNLSPTSDHRRTALQARIAPSLLIVGCIAVASLLRIGLAPLLGTGAGFLIYFPAVFVCAWLFGLRGGVAATVLAAAVSDFLFISPTHSLRVHDLSDLWKTLIFILEGFAVSALGEAQLLARLRAESMAARAREDHARKSVILDVALDCIICIDAGGNITEYNPAAEAVFGYSRDEALGKNIAETIIPPEFREQHRAGLEHYLATGEGPVLNRRIELPAMRKGGEIFPAELAIMPIKSEGTSQFAAYLRDISESRAQAAALSASEEHLRLAIEGANIGTWRWDMVTGDLTMSPTMERLLGRPGTAPNRIEGYRACVHTDDRAMLEEAIAHAAENNADFGVEMRILWPDESIHWQVGRGRCYEDEHGNPVRMEGIGIDITARKAAEEQANLRAMRADALNTISKAIRESRDPQHVQDIALAALGETLGLDRSLVILLNESRNLVTFVADWHRPDLPDLRGDYNLTDFGVMLQEVFPDSKTLVVNDLDSDTQLPQIGVDMLRRLGISALVDIPLAQDGQITGVLGIYMNDAPRVWTPGEISFAEAVASQLVAASEAVRVLTEAQNRAKTEELVSRIGDVMRTSLDPDEIQGIAVQMLGEALGADRCYFAIYNLAQGEVAIGRDWHRNDLPSAQGVHVYANTAQMFKELHPTGTTSIIVDRDTAALSEQTIANMKSLDIRSRISAALADPKGMATLTAAMADGPREWTDEELQLMQKVAGLLRSGLETVRAQQREHRIATDLQAALLPELPKWIPGLQIGGCMEPALDEAEIGGDFADVFSLDKQLYALVIGDVSGKGLAAAGQLATVRNSLRTSLYFHRTPAEALTMINQTLTVHELLNGFVTVFAGVYDALTGCLTFSSCGHEPALLRRSATGSVERLSTAGIPLGIDENTTYLEATVTLASGDALLLYTDGLSEAGPNRLQMLSTSGLEVIFTGLPEIEDADVAAHEIVARAKVYANAALRDDVCVLVALRAIDNSASLD